MKDLIGIEEWDKLPNSTKTQIISLIKAELRTELMLPPEPTAKSDGDTVEAVFINRHMVKTTGSRGSTYDIDAPIKGAPCNLQHNRIYLINPKRLNLPYFRLPNEVDYKRMTLKGWTVTRA